jgi:hypothetical protein
MGSAETAAACLARARQIAPGGCRDPDPEWRIARWRPASAEVARACFELGPGRETLIEDDRGACTQPSSAAPHQEKNPPVRGPSRGRKPSPRGRCGLGQFSSTGKSYTSMAPPIFATPLSAEHRMHWGTGGRDQGTARKVKR